MWRIFFGNGILCVNRWIAFHCDATSRNTHKYPAPQYTDTLNRFILSHCIHTIRSLCSLCSVLRLSLSTLCHLCAWNGWIKHVLCAMCGASTGDYTCLAWILQDAAAPCSSMWTRGPDHRGPTKQHKTKATPSVLCMRVGAHRSAFVLTLWAKERFRCFVDKRATVDHTQQGQSGYAYVSRACLHTSYCSVDSRLQTQIMKTRKVFARKRKTFG